MPLVSGPVPDGKATLRHPPRMHRYLIHRRMRELTVAPPHAAAAAAAAPLRRLHYFFLSAVTLNLKKMISASFTT